MFFWEGFDSDTNSKPFLFENNRVYSFQDIFEKGDQLFSKENKKICLILCGKNYETVTGYVGALRNNIVPLLLSNEMAEKSLEGYIFKYSPDYILLPKSFPKMENFKKIDSLGNYSLLAAGEELDIATEINDDLALLIPTSGSTGDPKCVRLSKKNLHASVESISCYLSIQSDERAVSILPFNYSYGLSVLNCQLYKSASMILTEKSVLDREFWHLLSDKQVTSFSAVPFIYKMMKRMKLKEIFPASMKTMTQAGGRLDPKLTQFFSNFCKNNNIKYFTMYGQTEASPRISFLPPEMSDEKMGSVGIPVPGGQVYLNNEDKNLKEGHIEGELVYEGANVALGYANCRLDLEKGDEFNGILHTGDQAKLDNDGYIYIIGRRKRFVKAQGNSINLDFIEGHINENGFDCAVVGKEDKIVICVFNGVLENLKVFFRENFDIHGSNVKFIDSAEKVLNSSSKLDYRKLEEIYL